MPRAILRSGTLIAAISLFFGVIWQAGAAAAASAPVITSIGRISEGLSVPTDLALDSAGNLYVAEPRSELVLRFNKYGEPAGSYGPLPVAATCVAVSPDGKVLYAGGKTMVLRIDAQSGELLGYLGSGGPEEFGMAYALAVDAQGFIYVADGEAKNISVYAPGGGLHFRFGTPGVGPGQFANIAALGFDPGRDEIHVADNFSQGASIDPKVQVFSKSGALLRTLLGKSAFGSPALTAFGGMAFDDKGRGYFLDSLKGEIRVLRLPNTYLSFYRQVGYGPGQLATPLTAVYDAEYGRLLVLCADGRIEILGIDGGTMPVRVNNPSSAPVPISPLGGSQVATALPTLTFTNSLDPDDDILTYTVEVYRHEALVAAISDIVEHAGESTSLTLTAALEENAGYQWRVQAFDGEAHSPWSSQETFYVNAVQEPPGIPELIRPLHGELMEGEGVLEWTAVTDPDPFDQVHYWLEIATEADFAAPLISIALEQTAISLSEIPDYEVLEQGVLYRWRVRGVDNHGLASDPSETGAFTYGATILRIESSLSGARVYLGGNHAYPGRYVGETPLTLRDIPDGDYALVVQMPGFEPHVAALSVAPGLSVLHEAELVPQLLPGNFVLRALAADVSPGEGTPFLVDLDGDGRLDLLMGDQAGRILLLRGIDSARDLPAFAPGQPLDLPLIPGAAPFVVDWNNNDLPDLLVGGADGSVVLFVNQGLEGALRFDQGTYLVAATGPVDVGGMAVPFVADLNGNGKKDLLVGGAEGQVFAFFNQGSDAQPQLGPPQPWFHLEGARSPFRADLTGDGSWELLIAVDGDIRAFARDAQGHWQELEEPRLAVEEGQRRGGVGVGLERLPEVALGKGGKGVQKGRRSLILMPDIYRFFLADLDGRGGKDVIFVDENHDLQLLQSQGSAPVPVFWQTLAERVALIAAALDGTAQVKALALAAAVGDKHLAQALALASELTVEAADQPETGAALKELKAVLQRVE
ncbi:FG-GAP-like repeat-containing protein [Geoalkalibacter halelectricus]|uniref:FG-GAP-like repeat-containing protein n=1 Tax=Geoalkalibacter halelectricus TaxID=2847045 RepID=UPI003D1DBC79